METNQQRGHEEGRGGQTGKPHEVDERRAAVLVGLQLPDLRSLAHEARLGHIGPVSDELRFTYDELRQLCLLAASAHL